MGFRFTLARFVLGKRHTVLLEQLDMGFSFKDGLAAGVCRGDGYRFKDKLARHFITSTSMFRPRGSCFMLSFNLHVRATLVFFLRAAATYGFAPPLLVLAYVLFAFALSVLSLPISIDPFVAQPLAVGCCNWTGQNVRR